MEWAHLDWARLSARLEVMAQAEDKSESDVSSDEHVAGSRATGGGATPNAPDDDSTTGTGPTSGFVGRVAGADEGDVGESGAEVRAQAAKED